MRSASSPDAGLGDEQVVEIHAELPGVLRVERVLDVDEGREAAAFLRLGDDGEGERGLAGGLRAEDFDDAAAGEAADAEGAVDEEVAGRDRHRHRRSGHRPDA